MNDTSKKRGRPSLPPEERERRRVEHNKKANERHKNNGYAAQKKYKEAHPEKYKGINYEPKVRISMEYKPVFEELLNRTGLSITQIFLGAVEEKYNVSLHKEIDNSENE